MKKFTRIFALVLALLVACMPMAVCADAGEQTNFNAAFTFNIPASWIPDMDADTVEGLCEVLSALTFVGYENPEECAVTINLADSAMAEIGAQMQDDVLYLFCNDTTVAIREGEGQTILSTMTDALLELGLIDESQAEALHASIDEMFAEQTSEDEEASVEVDSEVLNKLLANVSLDNLVEVVFDDVLGHISSPEMDPVLVMDEETAQSLQSVLNTVISDEESPLLTLADGVADHEADNTASSFISCNMNGDDFLKLTQDVIAMMPDELGLTAPSAEEWAELNPTLDVLVGLNESGRFCGLDLTVSFGTDDDLTYWSLSVSSALAGDGEIAVATSAFSPAGGEMSTSSSISAKLNGERATYVEVCGSDDKVVTASCYGTETESDDGKQAGYEFTLDASAYDLPLIQAVYGMQETTVDGEAQHETVFEVYADGDSVFTSDCATLTGEATVREIVDPVYLGDMNADEIAEFISTMLGSASAESEELTEAVAE